MNTNIDFFGVRKKTKKTVATRPFFFSNKPTSGLAPSRPKLVTSYWGGKTSNTFSFGKPLYRKERIGQKHLSKWGDADMDGSPNYFDCDPHSFLRDAKKIKKNKLMNISKLITSKDVKGAKVNRQSKQKSKPEVLKANKREPAKWNKYDAAGYARRRMTPYLVAEYEQYKKDFPSMVKEAEKRAKEDVELQYVGKGKAQKEFETRERVKQLITTRRGRFGPRTEAEQKAAEVEASVEEKLLKRKMPSGKELKEIARLGKRKLREVVPTYKVDVITKTVPLTDEKGNKIINPETGEVMTKEVPVREELVKTGEEVKWHPSAVLYKAGDIIKGGRKALTKTYGKEERVATATVRKLVRGGLTAAFGETLMRPQTSRGRPRGPSGKYMIEGKPVFEEAYQQWASKQRALNRITPSAAQEAPVDQEQIQETQFQQPQPEAPVNEVTPMSAGEIEATKMITPVQRGPSLDDIKQAQELAQQQDNVLNAPNILKGELKATGGSLLTPTGPQIMDAPNAFKGQLRTLNRSGDVPAVRLSERPQTNPYGDEYIDIELGSGRPVLKKRPREKWMTGEAL